MPRTTLDIDASILRELKRRHRRRAALARSRAGRHRRLIGRPQVVVAGEGERFWAAFKSAARAVQPRGALVPGAHLVALMHEHGVAQVWSNDRDLRKFDGISVLNPFDAKYSAGFEEHTPGRAGRPGGGR